MHELDRVLSERSDQLIGALTTEVGLPRGLAARFLTEAGPALMDSYKWHTDGLFTEGTPSITIQDLLGGVNARDLAVRVGLSVEDTWASLRALAPTVIRAGITVERDVPSVYRGLAPPVPPTGRHLAPSSDQFGRPTSGMAHPSFGLLPAI